MCPSRGATDLSIATRNDLRYLGLKLVKKSYVFGDNSSVVTSSTIPHSQLQKRHNALAYHRVREAIASGIIEMHHIPGDTNPADILSKHWGYQQVWPMLQATMFWHGDTADLFAEGENHVLN